MLPVTISTKTSIIIKFAIIKNIGAFSVKIPRISRQNILHIDLKSLVFFGKMFNVFLEYIMKILLSGGKV